MEQWNINVGTLVEILGLIIALGSAGAVVAGALKPFKNQEKKVKEHDKKINVFETKIEEVSAMSKMECKALLVLIDHELTGNGKDRLKEVKDEIHDFLVEAKK